MYKAAQCLAHRMHYLCISYDDDDDDDDDGGGGGGGEEEEENDVDGDDDDCSQQTKGWNQRSVLADDCISVSH